MADPHVRVVINAEHYLRAEDGPVMRHMMVVGEAVKVETIRHLKDGFPRDFLAPTIVKRVVHTEYGPAVQVGSDHTKTDPHMIFGNPLLVFFWARAGRTVHLPYVHHPGSEFHNYLLKLLVAALRVVQEGA